MFSFRDLFQWERFVTPSIIKLFFWLTVALIILFGLSGIGSAVQMMATSAGVGVFMLLGSLLGMAIGMLCAHRRRSRPDRVPHQRASRCDPRSRRADLSGDSP